MILRVCIGCMVSAQIAAIKGTNEQTDKEEARLNKLDPTVIKSRQLKECKVISLSQETTERITKSLGGMA